MDHDFEDIEVKRNSREILENQLRRKRKACMVSTGAMTDPYIPLEEELRVTRSALEAFERFGFGVVIQTKSSRILRDLDLLKAINAKTKCVVAMTLTTYDEALCKILEPNVSTTLQRFEVLKIMKAAGIPTVVWICPVLPFINDTEENLVGILEYCKVAGVRAIINFGFGLTLRDGNREYFYEKLDENFPGMKERYVKAYGLSYECLSPNDKALRAILKEQCDLNGIMTGNTEIFQYMSKFESKKEQLRFF
jgi:DNA repair photolyase